MNLMADNGIGGGITGIGGRVWPDKYRFGQFVLMMNIDSMVPGFFLNLLCTRQGITDHRVETRTGPCLAST